METLTKKELLVHLQYWLELDNLMVVKSGIGFPDTTADHEYCEQAYKQIKKLIKGK